MNFNFFKRNENQKQIIKVNQNNNDLEDEFSENELLLYDENLEFYYSNLINSLKLYTYNSVELQKYEPILIDPLTELYEELDYAFLPVCFETIFRNDRIDLKFKERLLKFKMQVDDIPNDIWNYENIDFNSIWKDIKVEAENLLTQLKVESRDFDTKFHNVFKR